MDKFAIERFTDGFLMTEELVETDQRLLNEADLDVITLGKDKAVLFIRSQYDTDSGYFIGDDKRWAYGSRKQAENTIKSRI